MFSPLSSNSSAASSSIVEIRSHYTHCDQGVTSSPGWDSKRDVTFRKEQEDVAGHSTKGKSIGPTVTEAGYHVHRPGAQH